MADSRQTLLRKLLDELPELLADYAEVAQDEAGVLPLQKSSDNSRSFLSAKDVR